MVPYPHTPARLWKHMLSSGLSYLHGTDEQRPCPGESMRSAPSLLTGAMVEASPATNASLQGDAECSEGTHEISIVDQAEQVTTQLQRQKAMITARPVAGHQPQEALLYIK